jgi:phospholipid/cholesterol/gamma-HCH transport system substrate-binding protein
LLTRLTKIQLIVFTSFAVMAVIVLCLSYLRIPALLGIGRYTLYADLPRSGGLYATANVTYRGVTIGKVTAVEHTKTNVKATMSIDSHYKVPVDASANVHSVSAIGEQYLDLVSTAAPGQYLRNGQTITHSTVPSEVGPALDAANRTLVALPQTKIASLLDETSHAVGDLGPALQRLVASTNNLAQGFNDDLGPIDAIIANAAPILDSQVQSRDTIARWSRSLDTLASQAADHDIEVSSALQQAAPTADQLTAIFSDVRDALPQTLANLAIINDMLKRYHNGVEQTFVVLPQTAAIAQSTTAAYPDEALIPGAFSINQPPPCLTGFLPASQWRPFADTSPQPLPPNTYCKIPADYQGNVVRGSRNLPCVDVPGKRAATPRECRSNQPYRPLGTNPWYGDPNQIRNCPAPGARCDQPVDPGKVIPAPSINTGINPLPADLLPLSPAPISDPLTPPHRGSITCNGQQPNPCLYTPAPGPAIYSPQRAEVTAPDGTKFSITDSGELGDDGWKQMLTPAG